MPETGYRVAPVRVVERTAGIPMRFARKRLGLSETDLQRPLGSSRPTGYRLLLTLNGIG